MQLYFYLRVGQGITYLATAYEKILCCYAVILDMKGCFCHFTKWQIHPFISKGIFPLIWFKISQLFSLLTGITVLIQELNSIPKKRCTPSNYSSHWSNLSFFIFLFPNVFQILHTFQYCSPYFPIFPCVNVESLAFLFVSPSNYHTFQI